MVAIKFQVFAISLVAHDCLGSPLQLLLERCNDILPILGILAGLLFIEADNVAPIFRPNLLDLQGRWAGFGFGVNLFVAAAPQQYVKTLRRLLDLYS